MKPLWVKDGIPGRRRKSAQPKVDFPVVIVKAAQSPSDDFRPPERPALGNVYLQWGVKHCVSRLLFNMQTSLGRKFTGDGSELKTTKL